MNNILKHNVFNWYSIEERFLIPEIFKFYPLHAFSTLIFYLTYFVQATKLHHTKFLIHHQHQHYQYWHKKISLLPTSALINQSKFPHHVTRARRKDVSMSYQWRAYDIALKRAGLVHWSPRARGRSSMNQSINGHTLTSQFNCVFWMIEWIFVRLFGLIYF